MSNKDSADPMGGPTRSRDSTSLSQPPTAAASTAPASRDAGIAGSPPSSSHFRVHTQLSDSLRVTDTLHTSVLHDRNSSPRANNDDQTAAPPRTVPSREGQRPSLDERPGTLAPRQPPAPSDPAAAQPAASSAASSGTSTSHGAGITFGRSSEGIQPHPAHSPRFASTPEGHSNAFSHLHPWAIHIQPRPDWTELSEDMVTGSLPLHVYRHIPPRGYFSTSFARSLFPRRFLGQPSSTNPVPILEIPRIEDVVAFRQHAQQLINDILNHRYVDDSTDIARFPSTPSGASPTRLLPPLLENGTRPVLYQVVSRFYGNGVILEAKDFFIPGPDHGELQCLPLTQDSVNFLTRTRGFDRTLISVKDFVWVVSLRPTSTVLQHQDGERVLRRARIPRPSALETSTPFFFRVHEFILATPTPAQRNILGIVVAVTRRGSAVNNIYAAFEGASDSVRRAWVDERLGEFQSYRINPREARSRMSQMFSAASAALGLKRLSNTTGEPTQSLPSSLA